MQIQLEREGDSVIFEDLQRYLRRHPGLTRFLLNPAGITFAMGWVLATGILIGWLAVLAIEPRTAAHMMAMVGAEATLGREIAIPIGLQLGLPAIIVFGIVFTQDLIVTMWLYPLFYIFRNKQRGRATFWGYFFRKMEADAERNREKVQKYGAPGLFLFMLIPFAVNGPLIGAVLGKLAGIRTRFILPTVILATATGAAVWTAAWVLFRPQVEWFVANVGGEWIAIAVIGILVLLLSRGFVSFWHDLHHHRTVQRHRRELAARLEAASVNQTLLAESMEAQDALGSEPSRSEDASGPAFASK